MNELALFAGAGGGILGGHMLGWTTICAVERDAYAAQILAARQNDRSIKPFPIWSDVCSFDGKPWRGIVDVVSGGFPCQDISCAGSGQGLDGNRSGLWSQMARIIREVMPKYVFVENSPVLTSRGLGVILSDLAKMGFDARWGVFSACSHGAPHTRERLFLVAYSSSNGSQKRKGVKSTPPGERQSSHRSTIKMQIWSDDRRYSWWNTEPRMDRVADGMANKLDRVKSIGNGQVPIVAATAFNYLRGE